MNNEKDIIHNPGSKEAGEQGCICPIIDNHYGKGMPTEDGPQFWITAGCPLHGLATDDE